jgi:hypothetical protein
MEQNLKDGVHTQPMGGFCNVCDSTQMRVYQHPMMIGGLVCSSDILTLFGHFMPTPNHPSGLDYDFSDDQGN